MPRRIKYPNGYVQVTIILDPETKLELDIRKGPMSRGDYIKWLLEVTKDIEPPWASALKKAGEPHAETSEDRKPKGADPSTT